MNYKKVYYAIINKALRKERTGQRWKGDGNYYEKHHIVPRYKNIILNGNYKLHKFKSNPNLIGIYE